MFFAQALLASIHAASSQEGSCRIEIVQVQDYSNGMHQVISHMNDYTNWLTSLETTLSQHSTSPLNIRYGVSSFIDKPLPFLGYGWGDKGAGVIRDWCYRLHVPLTQVTSEDNFRLFGEHDAMPTNGGGNDVPENQFEAMMAAMMDSRVGWSTQEIDNAGNRVMKYAVLLTNAPAHGVSLGGEPKYPDDPDYSHVRWPEHQDILKGQDLWFAMHSYNTSWGNEATVYSSPVNDPLMRSLRYQFVGSEQCGPGSTALDQYIYLSGLDQSTFTAEQNLMWKNLKVWCGPDDILAYLGASPNEHDSDPIDKRRHPGSEGLRPTEWARLEPGGDLCEFFEYPNQHQVRATYESEKVTPIVLVPEGADENLFPWMEWAYGTCRPHVDANGITRTPGITECLQDFYSASLPGALVTRTEETNVPTTMAEVIIKDMHSKGCRNIILDPTPVETTSPPPTPIECQDTSVNCDALVSWLGVCSSNKAFDYTIPEDQIRYVGYVCSQTCAEKDPLGWTACEWKDYWQNVWDQSHVTAAPTTTTTTTTTSSVSTTTLSTTTTSSMTTTPKPSGPPRAVGYPYGCSDISPAEKDLLDTINATRREYGKRELKLGRYAQRAAKLKVHDTAWGSYYASNLNCGDSMHHWGAETQTGIYNACCYAGSYDVTYGSPNCMHYAVRDASYGHLENALSYEIAAGYYLNDCYGNDYPAIEEIYTSERLLDTWLSSSAHGPLITGEGGWDKDWTSAGIAIGHCRAVVWFVEDGPEDQLCSLSSVPPVSGYWWLDAPQEGALNQDLLAQEDWGHSGQNFDPDNHLNGSPDMVESQEEAVTLVPHRNIRERVAALEMAGEVAFADEHDPVVMADLLSQLRGEVRLILDDEFQKHSK